MRSILILMAAVAVAFVVVIWFGFWVHTKTTAIPDNIFGAVAYVAIFGVALFLGCWMLGISPWTGWTVREMFGPPARRRSPRVESEWHATAAQNAYLSDPSATATCAHLQPIERAMRRAGIDVRLMDYSQFGPVIRAACLINEGELRRVFQLPPSIGYREERDDPRADLVCGYCQKMDRARCDISVLHPQESRKDARWFPSPP